MSSLNFPRTREAGFLGPVFLLCLIAMAVWGGSRLVNSIVFIQNAGGYLKRAADANTVELAKENLRTALDYIEENELTEGYTSVLWRTPDEDVGFWYQNLRVSHEELEKVGTNTTQLERSNLLIKLRETLLDEGKYGTKVTVPKGISIYPNNTAYAAMGWFIGILLMISYMAGGNRR